MALSDHLQRAGDVAQHLRHGGFSHQEISRFIGLNVETVQRILVEVEQRRPKLCKGSCAVGFEPRALCPYCEHVCQLPARVRR